MLAHPLLDGYVLRLPEESDADALAAVVDADRAYLARWMPWAASNTPEDSLAFIRSARRQIADNDGLPMLIEHAGRVVGSIGFHAIDWTHRSTSLGYWIAEAEQGRGVVTSAARAMLDHAFGVWRLNRVEIRCGVDNGRSRAVPERLGFREEGTLLEAERVGDRWVDLVLYAMLAADWPGQASPS